MGALIAYELVRRMETEHHGPVWFGASGMLAPDAGRPTSAHVLQHPSGTFIPPASVSAVLARRMLEILKADLRLVDNYQYAPGPLLRTALSVFGGTADSLAPAPQLDRWSEHAVHGAARHLWPGGHFFLFDHAASVSARLVGSCRAALAAKALALQI
ncbi:Thioesterase domain-containing protein [Streptomyces indicus]|uniref:Thioesterase domain-containing protein n=2 Tax=Streptomyces indicus TaxID=417292 RepID=A0A1G9HN61_9ACTN|nr:Thioesterase domain-containing protein [Streptomyces indicus]